MSVPVERITMERLALWSRHLNRSHATPLLLVGVGHDHASGQLVLCTLDEPDITPNVLAAYLRAAIQKLEGA